MESGEGLGAWESAEVECSLARKLKTCFERMVRRSQLVGEVPEEKASPYPRGICWAQIVKNVECQTVEFHPSSNRIRKLLWNYLFRNIYLAVVSGSIRGDGIRLGRKHLLCAY